MCSNKLNTNLYSYGLIVRICDFRNSFVEYFKKKQASQRTKKNCESNVKVKR